ncbi:unnamed protein product [Calicophoron daubneyi]|uniref:SWIM-type domain-containing protein n=1 Tax=Calicophoron daubneyi TaxID=300641 RepID=A0AAV2TY09_CALDB
MMKHKIGGGGSPLSLKMRRTDSGSMLVGHRTNCVGTLFDLSAKVVAEHLPFEYVEKMLVHIPEPVQERIIYYSFPQRDSDIYTYASFHLKADRGRDKIPYYEGLEYFQNGCVEDVIQIGFHLTGSVKQQPSCTSSENEVVKYEVSITFDRCKIISVCCDCGSKGLSWCPHVVALALFRIRQPHLVDYRSPISDALVRMDRSQLQKFAQYLIASHPNKVLPSAQQLADQLLQPESSINKTSGAPDPTAGASVEDVAAWYLDEAGVREQLRIELANLAFVGSGTVSGLTGNSHTSSTGGSTRSNSNGGARSTSPSLVTANTHPLGATNVTGQTRVSDAGSVNQANHATAVNGSSNLDGSEQNDYVRSPSTEVDLNWLMRYRRLMLSQNLLNTSVSGSYAGLDFSPLSPGNSSLISEAAGIDRLSAPHFVLTNPSVNESSVHTSSCVHSAAGAQITAMFAKVRELLAKRDTNGPRLLSLITEELLRCPKLPVLKARRSHRTAGLDFSGRLQPPLSVRNSVPADSSSALNSNYSSSQLPPWIVRLWDEVCLLWTCIVLNPDCSTEARRQWRNRFLSWSHAHRCPRDEAYAVPCGYFTALHDSTDAGSNESPQPPPPSQQQGHAQTPNRNSHYATVFQLPLEVSFMSWDNEWLRHFLGFEKVQLKKSDPSLCDDQSDDLSSTVADLDEDNHSPDAIRRHATTPRRLSAARSSTASDGSRGCHCAYCDSTTPLNEPFPLLCLRVAALRSNGYLSQALRLSVFISQRLLRAFKSRIATATDSLFQFSPNPRSPLQSHCSYSPSNWNGGYPIDTSVRRTVFSAGVPNARPLITPLPHGSSPYSSLRYNPPPNMPSPSSPMPNPNGFSPSGHLPSPRSSSISPPVSLVHHRTGSRRHGMSPCGSSTPTSVLPSQPNWSPHSTCSGPPFYPYKSYPRQFSSPPQAFLHHSYPACHLSPTSPSSSSFHTHFQTVHSTTHGFQTPQSTQHSYPFSPPPYPSTPNYQSNVSVPQGRSVPSSKLSGRASVSYHPSLLRPPTPSYSQTVGGSGDSPPSFFIHLGYSSISCACHTDSGWVGLPGRPLICLIECLLDAAALAVESSNSHRTLTKPWNHLQSASFYLCLSVKVSLLALFQQRLLCASPNRLLASQVQESKLIALLNTMPKDTNTVLAVCELLSVLLGPPVAPRGLVKVEQQNCSQGTGCYSPFWWWWSSLGPVIHPDSYPVHGVAQFVLDYLTEGQKHNQLSHCNTCWIPPAGPSSVALCDLLYAVVTRAMRSTALRPASDQNGSNLTTARPNGRVYQPAPTSGIPNTPRVGPFPPRLWDNAHPFDPDVALAVNTDISESSAENASGGDSGSPDLYRCPSSTTGGYYSAHHPGPARSIPHALSMDGSDRWPVTTPVCPPFPSAFATAIQACLRLVNSPVSTVPVSSIVSLSPPALLSNHSSCQSTAEVNQTSSPAYYPQNTHLRRCLESFELQQASLAVALVRISKSHLYRLDQAVQIFDRHIHSAVSLLTISQQVFAEAVGLEPGLGLSKCDALRIFNSSMLNTFAHDMCELNTNNSSRNHLPNCSTMVKKAGCTRDRVNLVCTSYHLALLVVLRTLTRTVHWRRREMLAWAVTIALHVGPSACLYLVTHWATYITPREAVNCLAPALLAFVGKYDYGSESTNARNMKSDHMMKSHSAMSCSHTHPGIEHSLCSDSHTLMFGLPNSDVSVTSDHLCREDATSVWSPWYGFAHSAFTPRNHASSITVAAQLLSSTVPYSAAAREQISAAVRTMALQAASKDPVNCALPALTLSERNSAAFDAVYRLILNSAETGGLGPIQLFSLARYMDSRGWAWRAFPFALHATRLFVLSTMQENHPVATDVLWACSLAHRLGPGALQEILNNVIRNIHCPTLLTDILHRCRVCPSGANLSTLGPTPKHDCGLTGGVINSGPLSFGRTCPMPPSGTPAYPPTNIAGSGKLLTLDRPPLKGLLDAAINAFVMATHTRLSNISPRQYSEFVDFLARARDTFHLLRPDGPVQFRSLVECLRQTYRGKRKLVSLLAERFG